MESLKDILTLINNYQVLTWEHIDYIYAPDSQSNSIRLHNCRILSMIEAHNVNTLKSFFYFPNDKIKTIIINYNQKLDPMLNFYNNDDTIENTTFWQNLLFYLLFSRNSTHHR